MEPGYFEQRITVAAEILRKKEALKKAEAEMLPERISLCGIFAQKMNEKKVPPVRTICRTPQGIVGIEGWATHAESITHATFENSAGIYAVQAPPSHINLFISTQGQCLYFNSIGSESTEQIETLSGGSVSEVFYDQQRLDALLLNLPRATQQHPHYSSAEEIKKDFDVFADKLALTYLDHLRFFGIPIEQPEPKQ